MSEALLKHSRMPRKYKPKPGMPKPSGSENYGNLAAVDPQEVIRRYLADETTGNIAASYSVSRSALNQFLLRQCEDDWKEVQVLRAIARKDRAEEAIEAATDPLELAKAREGLKAAQWDLERTFRRVYGEDRPIESIIQPILNIIVSQETKQPRLMQVSVARARGAEQQYDSGAVQHEAVIDHTPVDKS